MEKTFNKINKKSLISALINYAIFITVSVCFVMGLFNTSKTETGRILSGWTIIRFFTVQSNVMMGLICLIYAIFETRVLTGKLNEMPKALYVLKHVFTVGVTVTFITVAAYLSPINKAGYFALFEGSNFFFHFLIPVISLLLLVFCDGEDMPFSYSFFGLIPFLCYGVFYLINAFIHIENGVISPEYDWYYLLQGGPVMCAISITVMTMMTFLISAFLRYLTKKRVLKSK